MPAIDSGLLVAWEVAREGVVIYGTEREFREDRVLYLNPSAAQLLGVERDRVMGRPLLLALRDHRLEALCHSCGSGIFEIRGRTLSVRAEPGVLLLLDQTEERSRLIALEEASRVLAHEFRTPVAGMIALLEALKNGLPEKEMREALGLLEQEAHRLKRLVEDLPLTKMPGQARTFSLEELRPRLERFLANQLAERSAWIDWQATHTVRANPDGVYQALLNLLGNALKYGPGGAIKVVSGRLPEPGIPAHEGIWLEVQDGGAPLEAYELLFQPGQRGTHAAHIRGSGLGLALVRRLAASWGGQAYGRRLPEANAFGFTLPEGERDHDAREFRP
jgi:signal transduction histidine kinase